MSPASHIVVRLRKLYGIVWSRMRFLNEQRMNPRRRLGRTPQAVMEQFEPRLLLTGDPSSLVADILVPLSAKGLRAPSASAMLESGMSAATASADRVILASAGTDNRDAYSGGGSSTWLSGFPSPLRPGVLNELARSGSVPTGGAGIDGATGAFRSLGNLPEGVTARLGLGFQEGTYVSAATVQGLAESQGKTLPPNIIHVSPPTNLAGIADTGVQKQPASQALGDDPGAGIEPSADSTVLYTTGFESGQGFAPGFIGFQGGWSYFSGNTTQPVISTSHPSSGAQHLRIAKDSALDTSVNVGAFSPNQGPRSSGHYAVSLDVAISATGGADYYVNLQSPSQGLASAVVDFTWLGDIYLVDDLGSGSVWHDTGVNWTTGAYKTLTIDLDASADTIKYYYGGSLIYTGTVWAGTSVEQVVVFSDNWNISDVGDFDNLTIESLNPPQADLTNVRFGNWDEFIPVDVTQQAGSGAHSYDGPYYSDQPLYFNWVSANIGTGVATDYTVRAEVTGPGGGTLQWTGLTTASGSNTYLPTDQAIGPLAAGTHTFKVWLDYGDTVDEVDEWYNYLERTITVLPTGSPDAQDVTIKPLGVSPGVSWFQAAGQITGFGGETVYAADLVAGQRLSASVQTPEYGGRLANNPADVTIPDSGTPAVSEITLTSGASISDLDVIVYIDHRGDGDLDIFLVSPGGTRFELSTDNGGTGNNYYNTIFDDEAATAITDPSAQAPFYGRYRPEAGLSALDGADPTGTWRLEISDDTPGNSPSGLLLGWALVFDQGLDVALTITGPDGELAYNGAAVSGISDAAVVNVTVPTTGRYLFKVGNQNLGAGAYTLEGGIYEASVPSEAGATTDLDPLVQPNGNVAVLGQGDGVAQQDVYTITLYAGEAVNIAATTPGGFYAPYLQVAGPDGFDAGLPYGGPDFDTVFMFTAPGSGTYTITVSTGVDRDYTNVISTGSYALTVSLSDLPVNNSLADARPISSFSYDQRDPATSWYFGVTGEEGIWRGAIAPDGEADYFHLGELAAGQLIRVAAQREGASQLFPLILLANSSAEIITWGNPFRSPLLEGFAFFETIISAPGDYYAVVIGDTTVAGGSIPSGGAYDLFYADFGVTEDVYEQNDSKAQVDARTPGAANSPNLGVVGPVTVLNDLAMMEDSEDWFRFETTATGTRGDYVRALFSHAQGNLSLDVLDAGGNLIRRSQSLDDNERVSLQGLPAGTYYARVFGHNGARNPEYSLRIQSGAPDERLLSGPFTTDALYDFSYTIGGTPGAAADQALQMGDNELIVTAASGGPSPFEMIFDVTRVGTMADQEGYQYDLLGNLSRRSDAMGRDTVYDYDPLGRLVWVDGPALGDATAFAYDGNDNLTQMVDASAGTTLYTYNALDQLTLITLPNGLGTVAYTYNLGGRVASISYPGGSSVAYTYDLAGRLATVIDGADVTTYAYNAAGQLASMTQPNGVAAGYGYDQYGRLTDLAYTLAGALVTSFHYTLDANGNRTAMEVRRQDTSTPEDDYTSGTYGYGYDVFSRLVRASYPDGSVVQYTYDANGNRLSLTTDPDGAGPQPAVVENYHYGYDNRLESITGAGGAMVKQFYYDPRGNVTMVVTPTDTTRYEYDYRNMLTAVETGGTRIEYVYDGRGDRVTQYVNGVRTNFVNDPNRDYTQVLAELDASGAQESRYTYGLGRISGLLPGETDEVYYVADALGSTTDLLDPAGAVLTSYNYDAFGALRPTSPAGGDDPLVNEFLFTGEDVDPATGLVYLRARYYDPSTGRFLSKDPVGFDGGMNPHLYVSANPVNLIDPSGLLGGLIAGQFGDIVGFWLKPPNPNDPLGEGFKYGLKKTLDRSQKEFERKLQNFQDQMRWEQHELLRSSLDRGGVLLNRAADFVGDLTQVTGATVDPVTGQVVLLGTQGGTVQGLRLDDFVSAVRAVFGSAEDPGVTIDPQPGSSTAPYNIPQLVHLFGGTEDTDMGEVMFEADRVMKCLGARKDNIQALDLNDYASSYLSQLPGYQSLLGRWVERSIAEGGSGGSAESRFWFVPSDVKLVRSDNGESFVFDKAAVKLMTEDMLVGNGATDPDAQEFADWFNANFETVAGVAYPYPSSPGYEYSFQRLEQVARAVAFARFLYDNNIPVDFSWMENYQVAFVDTPDTTPTVVNSATWEDSEHIHTIIMTGGVTMDTPNTYVSGASGLQGTVLGSRPSDVVQQWTTTVNGETQTAVALSMNTSFVDGLGSRADADLSYQTPGDIPFGLMRYYNSAKPLSGSFGYAWDFIPADIDFNMPEFYTSYYAKQPSPYLFLNGLHSGEVRVNDRAGGRVLTFESSFDFRLGSANGFGLNAQGVPDFTAGGSEKPDGSTLTQDPITLAYTLTRPDGSGMILDHEGKLLAELDSRGRGVAYGYTSGRVGTITDSAGQTITLSYDGSGRVTLAQGLDGETVAYTYSADGLGNLTEADRVRDGVHSRYVYSYNATASADDDHLLHEVTPPQGVVESRSWSDILGRTTASEDARGNRFEQDFDSANRATVTTDTGDGSTREVQTDSLGRPVVVTDEMGRTTQYYYDVERVFGVQYPGGWTYVQFTNGTNRQPSLVRTPDPSRPWLYYEYDARGNVTRSEDLARGGDANGDGIDDNPQLFAYDAANNLVSQTDARGNVTTYTYETLSPGTPEEQITNRRTLMTQGVGTADEATWQWQYYEDTGYLQRQIDPSGVVTEYTYDPRGNLLTETIAIGTPDEAAWTYGYDVFSRRTSVTDGEGRQTEFVYDGRDQVVTTRLVGASPLESHSSHDPATGRKLSDMDFVGNVTTYSYDSATGDMVSQTGAAGTADESVTGLQYDRFGNVKRVVDPVGNVTEFTYDSLQRLVHKTSLGSTTRITGATGTNSDIVVTFSDPIDSALVDNGVDVLVKDSGGGVVPGTVSFSADGLEMTWTAGSTPLAIDTYTITLRASGVGEFTTVGGQLLDGEFFGMLPSGDNSGGGDFVFSWFVDDYGNDADHSTLVTIPSSTPAELEFAADHDWFRVNVAAGNRLRFEVVLGSQSGALYDSNLALYDQDGTTIVATSDDIDATTGQFGSRIDWEAPRTGSYYLKVTSFGAQYTGDYQLDVALLGDDHSDVAPGNIVSVPSVTPGTLEVPTDNDIFSFQASAGSAYRITTILGTLADSTLALLGADGTGVLASNDNYFTGNPAAFIYWTAPSAGTYHIRVAGGGGAHVGDYQLAVSIDDHGDYASVATPADAPSQTSGQIEVPYDADWFSFTAVSGNYYRLEADGLGLADPFLAVFDSGGMLEYNDDYEGSDARMFWLAPGSGTYYLKVTGHDGTGAYRVGVTELADDHGNSAAAASPVAMPGVTAGNVELPGDRDWFRFTAEEGRSYRFDVNLGDLVDSVVRVYGSDGITLLAENDDYAGQLRSRLHWTAPDDGDGTPETADYYAVVLSNGPTATGSYTLDVSAREIGLPQGSLVSPTAGTFVTVNPGYVNVAWTDLGSGSQAASGIKASTVDLSDVSITGVTVTGVAETSPGSGVWRYSYSGTLPQGAITVTLRGLHVSDNDDNWNLETTATFAFDSVPPAVDMVDVAPDPRLTAVDTITITFSEEVAGFGIGDLVLSRGGGGNLLSNQPLTTTDGLTYTLGGLTALTSQEGTYTLSLDSSASGITDLAGHPLTSDSSDVWVKYNPAEIHGRVFHDVNENGQQDAGEEALPNWDVYLDLNNDRERDAGEPQTTSGIDGTYAFTNLFPGTYTVTQQRRAGWVQTYPDPGMGHQSLGGWALEATGVAPITWTGSDAPVFTDSAAVDWLGGDGLQTMSSSSISLINLDDFQADWRFEGIRGAGYSVVVLDTGADLNHPFFGPDTNSDGIADRIVYQYDFGDGDANASDVEGHGSNVASIIGSQDSTYGGVAPEVSIIVLKVFRDSGTGTFGMIEGALQWVVANAAAYHVVSVNMSLGDSGNYASSKALYGIHDELAGLASQGVIAVAAAGNDFYQNNSVQGVSYPAADPDCLAVSAVWASNFGSGWSWSGGATDYTTGADRIVSFSQRSATLTDIFAPGAMITGANKSGGIVSMGGTSQASPGIAGVAALAQQLAERELGRRLTPAEFRDILRSSAVTVHDGDDEDDNVTNTGLDFPRVDVLVMGEQILSLSGPGPGTYAVTLASGQVVENRTFGDKHLVTGAPGTPDLMAASDSGRYDYDNVTVRDNDGDARKLQFSVGNTIPGATVTVYAGGAAIGSTTAGGTSVLVTTNGTVDIADGAAVITARQTEPDKLESTDSLSLTVTIDTVAPTASVPDLNLASDTGLSSTDDITQGTNPQFDGTAGDDRSGVWKVVVNSDDGKSGTDSTLPFYSVTLATLNEGGRTVTATAYDVAGNTYTTSALPVTVDRTAPRVNTFGLSSSWVKWALGTVDSSVWTAADRMDKTAPWCTINRLVTGFSESVYTDGDDAAMTGAIAGNVPLSLMGGNGTGTLTWATTSYLSTDRYRLTLFSRTGGIWDLAGNFLDGENGLPSGNGTSGGNWQFDLNVLVGNVVDRPGLSPVVDTLDRAQVILRLGKVLGDSMYSRLADINGDGRIDTLDRAQVILNLGKTLPTAPLGPEVGVMQGTVVFDEEWNTRLVGIDLTSGDVTTIESRPIADSPYGPSYMAIASGSPGVGAELAGGQNDVVEDTTASLINRHVAMPDRTPVGVFAVLPSVAVNAIAMQNQFDRAFVGPLPSSTAVQPVYEVSGIPTGQDDISSVLSGVTAGGSAIPVTPRPRLSEQAESTTNISMLDILALPAPLAKGPQLAQWKGTGPLPTADLFIPLFPDDFGIRSPIRTWDARASG